MTIILTLANDQQVIQISDRQLTNEDGSIYKPDSNKATMLFCRNGRFGIGYTGLAQARSFNTQSWIIDSLIQCGDTDLGIAAICHKFSDIATDTFRTHRDLKFVLKKNKRLTVMFSGYFYVDGIPLINVCVVSNFQDTENQEESEEAWDQFKISVQYQNPEKKKSTDALIRRVGAWKAMTKEEDNELMSDLINKSNPKHIRNKAMGIVRKMADRPVTGGTVGKDLTIVNVPVETDKCFQSEYHPYGSTWEQIMPDLVFLQPNSKTAVTNISISPVDEVPETAWGRTMGPNRLCHCGSKKRFADCHGNK